MRPLPLLSLVSLLVVAGCKPAAPTGGARGGGPIPVELGVATRSPIPISFSAIGTIQPIRTVAVKSQVDGVVEKFHVQEGQMVAAGDLLVSLDPRPLQNSVRMATAELANARAEEQRARSEAERYRQLARVSAISEEQENQLITRASTALAVLQVKEAALSNAELMLDYTQIRAPFAGRIGQHGLHEGALVKANDSGTTLLTLHQLAPISVAFSVPDRLQPEVVAAVANGSVRVVASLRQDASRQQEGKLTFVDNAIDPTTGTLMLKAEFANDPILFWPGAFVESTLYLGEIADAILVPEASVQAGQAGSQVFVAKADQTVELRPVTTGRRWNGRTQILSGIQEGDTVVTDGQLRLTPGARIAPKGNPVSTPAS